MRLHILAQNKAALALFGAAALALAAMLALSGCSLDDHIAVRIPPAVQAELGVPATMPLSQARDLSAQYAAALERRARLRAAAAKEKHDALLREVGALNSRIEAEAAAAQADFDDLQTAGAASLDALGRSIGRADQLLTWAGGLVNTGLAAAAPAAAGVPGGALIFGALTGLAGLMLPKPGTQAAKDASYDQGAADLASRLRELYPALSIDPRRPA